MNGLTDRQEIWNYFDVLYKNPRNVSRKFEKDSSSRTGYHDFKKEVRQWTDWQTYKKSEIIFELVYKHPRNVSRKFEEDSTPRTGYIQR